MIKESNIVEADDWREETQVRLKKSSIYLMLVKKCAEDPAGSQVITLVDDAVYYAYQRTKTIVRHMGEFTLHDGEHLFRVLKLMRHLISRDTLEKLTIPELMLLILSAFFHDVGMAPDEETVIAWKKNWDDEPEFENKLLELESREFGRFVETRPDLKSQLESLLEDGKVTEADFVKAHLIGEYIRLTHAERAKKIIEKDWLGKVKYRDADLTTELATICFSHNEDPHSVLQLELSHLCGPGSPACLRLVAALLRMADILDFDAKRTPSVLFSHLHVKNPISIQEWEKHRSVESWVIGEKEIRFHAKCQHPAIESSIHSFCDLIDTELSGFRNVVSTIEESQATKKRELGLQLPFKVDRSGIDTAKDIQGKPIYIYKETRFSLSKKQVIDLLMGTKLYGDSEAALRELVQNSIDACLLRKALESKWGNHYVPEIQISYLVENDNEILVVKDNGTGMDQEIIDRFYSNVGTSFYKSGEFYKLKSESNATFNPTSRFGIGILSCFMVSDSIEVETRRVYGPHSSSSPLNLTIEGQESIFWIREGAREKPGTTTKLNLRKKTNPWDGLSADKFISTVKALIPNPPFKIKIEGEDEKKTIDQHSFKQVSASSLASERWNKHPNVVFYSVELSDVESGILGSVEIALLEEEGSPIRAIELTSRSIKIEGEDHDLERSIRLSSNEISAYSTTISVDEDGHVDSNSSSTSETRSSSQLSLHGIQIPMTLFPRRWERKKNQVSLIWPFPTILVLDVCGELDLDLNSARTQIIPSEKWNLLEKRLATKVVFSLKEQMEEEYWNSLFEILNGMNCSPIFLESLREVGLAGSASDDEIV
ncbi:ATP-binding protein [Roseibacillus persicicus]|uniref:HD domain-containing protein n=1 Tax=Roseibacillus persicicus TaxID=454148 RepID=UPI00398AD414